MNMQAKTFHSGAELIGHYAAVRSRLMGKAGFERLAIAPPSEVIQVLPPVPRPQLIVNDVPEWMRVDTYFDAHLWSRRQYFGFSPQAFIKQRCEDFGITVAMVQSVARYRSLVKIRQQIIWEVHHRFSLSLPQIGRLFGGRDHTTVLHAIRRVDALRAAQ